MAELRTAQALQLLASLAATERTATVPEDDASRTLDREDEHTF
jgi:hypothetical protein